MTSFYSTTNSRVFTTQELDIAALDKAGIIASLSGGYNIQGTPAENPEYDFVWVGTGGTGNSGNLVLKGKTPRARRLLRAGKIEDLIRKGVSLKDATEYYEAARGISYTHEGGVQSFVIGLKDHPQLPLLLAGWNEHKGSVDHFCEKWLVDREGLSGPRLSAAFEVLKNYL